jgi:hypothetical protein
MKNKIINYLILKIMEDEEFEPNPSKRVRSAFIIAQKQYPKLSEQDKELIIEKLKLKD